MEKQPSLELSRNSSFAVPELKTSDICGTTPMTLTIEPVHATPPPQSLSRSMTPKAAAAAAATATSASTEPKKKPMKYSRGVSGHHLLLTRGDGKLLKQGSRREENFYNLVLKCLEESESPQMGTSLPQMASSFPQLSASAPVEGDLGSVVRKKDVCSTIRALRPYIPQFFGAQVLTPSMPDLHEAVAKELQERGEPLRMITLQDVCAGFERPCVLDMKMGTRQYGLNAPDCKVETKTRKARESTSSTLGMRIHGFRKWSPSEQSYLRTDKYQCRALSAEGVRTSLKQFLNHDPKLIDVFHKKASALKDIFSRQNHFRFFTSSLLMVYDFVRPYETAGIYMVDFAYTYTYDEVKQAMDISTYETRDEGYLQGLKTLAHHLSPATPIQVPPVAPGHTVPNLVTNSEKDEDEDDDVELGDEPPSRPIDVPILVACDDDEESLKAV